MDLIPTDMGDAALWAVIVGFVSPIALNFLLKATWSDKTKSLLAFAFSAVVGTVTALIAGAYEGLGIPTTILLTAVVSISAYKGFWKNVSPQRGEAEAEQIKAENKTVEIAHVAQQVVNDLPVAEVTEYRPSGETF
jgi:nucleoside permease NupC